MIYVDVLISKLKAPYKVKETIRFDLPIYEEFHHDVQNFIDENHFENTPAWRKISENHVYKSSQYMIRSEVDIILVQLNLLKVGSTAPPFAA